MVPRPEADVRQGLATPHPNKSGYLRVAPSLLYEDAEVANMARRALLTAALGLTGLAPSGSHLYGVHIWLHAFTERTILVDGMQRAVAVEVKRRRAA